MQPWISHNHPAKQQLLALACIATGFVLLIGFRHFQGWQLDNDTAGFLLGLLLFVTGIFGLRAAGRQTITIDPQKQVIAIRDISRFGDRTREIAFSEIREISIGYLGKASNFVQFYFLVLKLRSGEEYPLFAPGRFYEGCADHNVVESWRRRLEEYLRQADAT